MVLYSKSPVFTKLTILLSSTLAHNNSGRLEQLWSGGSVNNYTNNDDNNSNNNNTSTCSDPCEELNQAIHSELLVLVPTAIACLFSLAAAFPSLALKSKNRVLGVKSFLWVLFQLWVYLLITHFLFKRRERAQAYVWALHSASHALSTWAPGRGVMMYPGLHWTAMALGAACVGLFAWQIGPSVGLAAWNDRGNNNTNGVLCGWTVHLKAILGVELVQWVLGPVEGLLMGL
jgi:hypothetical protein